MPAPAKSLALFAAICLCSLAEAARVGEPLAQALTDLQRAGLRLIFSTALIEPQFTVKADPGPGTPVEIANRILAPYALTLRPVRPDLFAVVRMESHPSSAGPAESKPASAVADAVHLPPEVDIYASRYAIEPQRQSATAHLSSEDLHALAGLGEDALRVTHYLPGMASSPLSARSHVRGGRDDELAVFFDGAPLFEPFHYKDLQSLLGLLDPQTVSTIDFFSGVFPVRYGDRLSGVLDIRPRAWNGTDYDEIGASLLYAHALSQGRLESYPLEWLGSVRRGSVDLVADVLGRRNVEPKFLDALGRICVDLGDRATLAVGGLLLDDGLNASITGRSEIAEIGYRDATGWATWRFAPDETSEWRATLSRTERHTARDGAIDQPGSVQGTLDDRRQFNTTTLRIEGTQRLNTGLRLNGGLEAYDYLAHYNYRSSADFSPLLASAFGRATTLSHDTQLQIDGEAYAAYASALLDLTQRVKLDFGLRWDAQRFGSLFSGDTASPRLSVQFDSDPRTVWRLSWGRFSQTERPDELQVQDGDARFHATERARQAVASLERRIASDTALRVEVYDKRVTSPRVYYENLLDPFALLPELEVDRVRVQPSGMHAYGAELNLRWQPPGPWSAWLSYTASQVLDRFDPNANPGMADALRSWDQKHALSAGLASRRGPWLLSGNLQWHSGWRRTELALEPATAQLDLSARNASTWPDYFSLDLRAAWTHSLSKGALEGFVEVINATNHDNLCCADYRVNESASGAGLTSEISGWLPRVFLVGLTWQLP